MTDAAGPGGLVERRVSSAAASPASSSPALVKSDAGYGVAWMDYRDFSSGVYFARLDETGGVLAPEQRVVDVAGGGANVDLAWTGHEYELAWSDGKEVYLTGLGASGTVIGPKVPVSETPTPSLEQAMIWTGDGFGVTWQEELGTAGRRSYFAKIAAGGTIVAEAPLAPESAADSQLVWTGDGFGVVWSDQRSGAPGIYFVELDGAGKPRSAETRVKAAEGQEPFRPKLAWTGDGYALAWSEFASAKDVRVHFRRLDRTGSGLGEELAWPGILGGMTRIGADFAILFYSGYDSPTRLTLARVAASRAEEIVKPDLVAAAAAVPLISVDASLAFAWDDARPGGAGIFFGLFPCR